MYIASYIPGAEGHIILWKCTIFEVFEVHVAHVPQTHRKSTKITVFDVHSQLYISDIRTYSSTKMHDFRCVRGACRTCTSNTLKINENQCSTFIASYTPQIEGYGRLWKCVIFDVFEVHVAHVPQTSRKSTKASVFKIHSQLYTSNCRT